MTVCRHILAPRRYWTPAEDDALRQLYLRVPCQEIAELLGRPMFAIYQHARIMGLGHQTHRVGSKERRRIRELHAEGYSDPEIAERLKFDRHAVSHARKRMGLESNRLHERQRRRVGRKTIEQCAKAGVPNLSHLRLKLWRDRARQQGWPEDLGPRYVQILNALWERGPMTRREISDAIGMPWKYPVRRNLKSNDRNGNYVAHLMARGLVVSLGRKVRTGRKGGNVAVYMLPLGIQREGVAS